ncbi:uncharacterized protein BYT42DRAFT_113421 [Radiomyces spectabilis]|uniref:uncharacterized protein n=1 Tax=Radiomyces spectabilis TaxID=64574 RepID=UPI00222124CC|nr:uncharacterized protein BYT42DRAFT_113421 [Radiomyces spectabilis]KAI8369523.1 hypothetical protein BYT42DRAFT_113421 [Radiomyces spectabilis]
MSSRYAARFNVIVNLFFFFSTVHSKVKVARKRLQASSASYRPLFQIVRNNTKAGLRQPLPHRVSSRVNLRRAPSQEALLISQQANQHRPAEESDSGIERRIKGYGAVVDHETGDSSVLSTSYNDHRS